MFPSLSDMPQLRDHLQRSLGSTYTFEREVEGGGMSPVALRAAALPTLQAELRHARAELVRLEEDSRP